MHDCLNAHQIYLASVRRGEINFATGEKGWIFDSSGIQDFGKIELTNRSLVLSRTASDGKINIRSGFLGIYGGSAVLIQNIGNFPQYGIEIDAKDIKISGYSGVIPSAIASESIALGRGGNISIRAESLEVGAGGVIRAMTFHSGAGGDLSLKARDIRLTNYRAGDRATFVITGTVGTGKGGDLFVEDADNLSIRDGANFGATTYRSGRSGDLWVEAKDIRVAGFNQQNVFRFPPNFLPNASSLGILNLGIGDSGNVNIKAHDITVLDGAVIGPDTFNSGNSHKTTIEVINGIYIDGDRGSPSFLPSQIHSLSLGSGDAGSLDLTADTIKIRGGGKIGIFALSEGSAGNLSVSARDIDLSGTNINFTPSAISIGSYSSVDARNLTVKAQKIRLNAGASIESSANATGNAGNVFIDATDSIHISGTSGSINPTLINAAVKIVDPALRELFRLPDIPSGFSGNLFLTTPELVISDGALLSVNNQGLGNAGTMTINASKISLINGGQIGGSSFSGEGGNISIKSDFIMMRNGLISTSASNAGDGGNIGINSNSLFLLNSSRITANAFAGDGGNIRISTPSLFVSGDSFLSASSTLGIDGKVELPRELADIGPVLSGTITFRPEQNQTDLPICIATPLGLERRLNLRPVQGTPPAIINLPLVPVDSVPTDLRTFGTVLLRDDSGDFFTGIAMASSLCDTYRTKN